MQHTLPLGSGDPLSGLPEAVEDDMWLLARATSLKSLARGLFVSMIVLYLATRLRWSPELVTVSFTLFGVSGLVGSLAGGLGADRWAGNRLYCGASVFSGVLVSVLLVTEDPAWLTIGLALYQFLDRAAASISSALIGTHFPRRTATTVRGLFRALGNLAISVGALVSAGLLFLDGPAFTIAFSAVALLEVLSGLQLAALHTSLVPDAPQGAQRATRERTRVATLYWAFVTLAAIGSMLYLVLDYLMPLWIGVRRPDAAWLVPTAVILNTTLVVLYQGRVSALAESPSRVLRLSLASAGALLLCTVSFALSSTLGRSAFIVCTLVGTALLTAGEIAFAAVAWTLSYELAPQDRIGAYQGLFGVGTGAGVLAAPPVMGFLVLGKMSPAVGWLLLGLVFFMATAGIAALTQHAESSKQWSAELSTDPARVAEASAEDPADR